MFLSTELKLLPPIITGAHAVKYYAGIGSRETPSQILDLMTRLAERLISYNYTLRSGGAPGADTAFELGAGNTKEIFLPWRNFNGSSSLNYGITDEALEIASKFHPAWGRCSDAAKKLHSRNVYQVLGRDLETPSSFVVCWTKDGGPTGGTGQAIRIAQAYKIPVFNLYNENAINELAELVKSTT